MVDAGSRCMPEKTISTSFQKRLAILGVVMIVATLLLSAQMVKLTVANGDYYREKAEARLVRTRYIPTVRGSIYDRGGRELAAERSSWDFAVDFEILTGEWQRRQALRQAKRERGNRAWGTMTRSQRQDAIEVYLGDWDQRVESVWAAADQHLELDGEGLAVLLNDIRQHVGQMKVAVWIDQLKRLTQKEGEARAEELFRQEPILEQKGMHLIRSGLSDSQAFSLRKTIEDLHRDAREFGSGDDPAFGILDSSTRIRGFDRAIVSIDTSNFPVNLAKPGITSIEVEGIASTLIGSVRSDVQSEDVKRRPFRSRENGVTTIDLSGYRNGHDLIGSRGVEYEYDELLHGSIGRITVDMADEEVLEEVSPILGSNVQLAIDVQLQARIRALLNPELGLFRVQQWHYGWTNDGTPKPALRPLGSDLRGAAVVVDVRSGETIAMVSSPSPSDQPYTAKELDLLRLSRKDVAELSAEKVAQRRELMARAPYTNRVVETVYAPGSIVKPLVYVAGVTDGVIAPDEVIECKGWYRCKDCKPRCWGWRPDQGMYHRHNSIGPVTAIEKSCNVYFYAVVPRGVKGIFRPNNTEIGRLLFGIGQDDVAWTPMHAAIAYARLAMNGRAIEPTLVLEPMPEPRQKSGDGRLWNSDAVDTALEGMRASVKTGTASAIRLPDRVREPIMQLDDLPGGPPTVWAKTGTSQVDNQASHGWYAGLIAPAGSTTPTYAFAVIVEHGNSGGNSAGPVAAQLIRQLAAEGYLGLEAATGSEPVEWIIEEPDS